MSSEPETTTANEMPVAPSEGSPVPAAAAAADSNKRKLEDRQLNNETEPPAESETNSNADALTNGTQEEENSGADESETKRQRIESNGDDVTEADGLVPQNGHQEEEKKGEPEEEPMEEEESEQPESADANVQPLEDEEPMEELVDTITQEPPKEVFEKTTQEPLETITEEPPIEALEKTKQEPLETITEEPLVEALEKTTQEPLETITGEPALEPLDTTTTQEPASIDNEKTEISSSDELGQPNVPVEEPSEQFPREGDVPVPSAETQPGSNRQMLSRKMEVPNDKVGVLIGKSGDTIRSLQDNSGAKIQIMRDADADPRSTTRPVELVGTLEDINKAEKLIKDVIAEAAAGGSPSLIARGFNAVQPTGGGEQVETQVPNEKVGLIIGKGGETIRNLQTRSGARIQLLQPNVSDGEQSKERTVRITGTKKQIETAREMIKDVMNQTVRPSPLSSGYSQQDYRPPRGSVAPQWGPPRGPHHSHSGYDYPQRGPYPSQNSQYPPTPYGNYPPHQAPRSNFGRPSWDQRPPPSMQGPSPQGSYNYGQHPGPEYGQYPPPYSQTPAQSYSHGYNEAKYDNHQHFGPQPTPYAQGGTPHSYGPPQDPYSKPPTYGMQPPQVPHSQPYGQPRPNQPSEVPYQGPGSSAQSYGQSMPPQQPYPYPSSGPVPQNYPNPQYGSVQTSDGYSHPPVAASSGSGYGQGYVQAGAQQPQPSAYPQTGATGGYGSYPTSQPTGYAEQPPPAANNATYGYTQGPADPSSYGAPPQVPGAAYPAATGVGQAGYAQPTHAQPAAGYDQSGGYGNVPAPVGYGKSASPQPGYAPPLYDASQMYGSGHR